MANCATPHVGQVIFDANYSGFTEGTSFSGFHIHDSPPASTVRSRSTPVYPAERMRSLRIPPAAYCIMKSKCRSQRRLPRTRLPACSAIPRGYYINIHTLVNPNGVIRAQLRNTDRMQFKVNMSTANEVPPITDVNASAPAVFTVHTIRNADGTVAQGVAIFDVNYRFPGADDLHRPAYSQRQSGREGPVTINTGLSGTNPVTTDTGAGNIYRIVYVNNAAGLATLNSLVANPDLHYVNLHTTTHPNGVVRSQLTPSTTAVPA